MLGRCKMTLSRSVATCIANQRSAYTCRAPRNVCWVQWGSSSRDRGRRDGVFGDGVLRGGRRDANRPKTVLLRADMDALPIGEQTDEDFASRNGAMHACGHDLHTAALVGAAHLLAAHRDGIAGDVVFMFQPGEEGWDGAQAMIAEGVLDAAGRRVDFAYGMHVLSNTMPAGVFCSKPGPMLSASHTLSVTVRGAGGHGSAPHSAKDPVVAAAEMITSLQTMVTRGSMPSIRLWSPSGSCRPGRAPTSFPISRRSRQPCDGIRPRMRNGWRP